MRQPQKSRRSGRGSRGAFAGNAQVGGALGVKDERLGELLSALVNSHSQFNELRESEIERIAAEFRISLAVVCGVASFYSLLASEPTDRSGNSHCVRICDGPACRLAGSEAIADAIGSENGKEINSSVKRTSCIGLCNAAPAVLVGNNANGLCAGGPVSLDALANLNTNDTLPYPALHGPEPLETRVLMKRIGTAKPITLNYDGLEKAVKLSTNVLLDQIEESDLRGRGGAGFSTGKKWRMVAASNNKRRFVICNADESEPGTFKDRVLMEGDPHLLIEGMTICALTVGAQQGVIYVRGEYSRAANILRDAIDLARTNRLLGKNICQAGFSFDIKLHSGAGAYICGEETALLESLEGRRGEPRCRPPYPTTSGYFNCPTVINNVETLCAIPSIIQHGPASFQRLGRNLRSGTKLFCISGKVKRPGVYEVPLGTTARELIFDLAGGMSGDAKFKVALCGGAAGMFINEEQLDVPLDYDSHRQGVPLGSGVLMVGDESVSVVDFLLWILEFFENESCGKCTPCRIGTTQVRDIVQGIAEGIILDSELDTSMQRLRELSGLLETTSLCGLGQSVAMPIQSAIDRFAKDFFEALHRRFKQN